MKPRYDLIQSGQLRPEDEAFQLDIAVYKDLNATEEYIRNENVSEFYKYPCNSLIFHPRDKVIKSLIVKYEIKKNVMNLTFLLQKYGSIEYKHPPMPFQWQWKNDLNFHFRLRIDADNNSTGDLMVIGPEGSEKKYGEIKLTDQLREMNDKIIQFRRVDNQWIFIQLRPDRSRNHGLMQCGALFKVNSCFRFPGFFL